MQKEDCHEFAERQGWEIVKEFSEKGVSGFKKSAKDRDQLQLLQQAAAAGEFDVLLVFMFDRLGRRDDETPFIVEWFTKQGVEVWSENEGQQRFDSHVDKLMNYIRYWQASGESMKNKIFGVCPNCGKPVVEREKGWFCENRECRFVLWKDNSFFKRLGKLLDAHVADKLLRDGRVRLKDCRSAKGKTYNATVLLSCEADGRSKFSLDFEGGF